MILHDSPGHKIHAELVDWIETPNMGRKALQIVEFSRAKDGEWKVKAVKIAPHSIILLKELLQEKD